MIRPMRERLAEELRKAYVGNARVLAMEWNRLDLDEQCRWIAVAEAALGHPYAEAGVVEQRDAAIERAEKLSLQLLAANDFARLTLRRKAGE